MKNRPDRKSRGQEPGRPSDASRRFEASLALHRAGRRQEAFRGYEQVLATHPRHAQALHYSALLLHEAGRAAEAAQRIDRALEVEERSADLWSNAGLIHDAVGRSADAMRCYRRALAIEPRLGSAWVNLSSSFLRHDDYAAAESAARQALAIVATHGALMNLAMALAGQGRGEDVLRLLDGLGDSTDTMVVGLRVQALKFLGETARARAVLHEVLPRNPDPRLRIERARFADAEGDAEGDAATALDDYRAIRSDPGADADLREAALSELVFLAKRLALWSELPPLRQAFRDGVERHVEHGDASSLTPFSFLSDESTRGEQRGAAAAWALRFRVSAPPPRALSAGRLRIGYLSADLHAHATGILAVGLFEHHDRERFEIFAYSTGPDDGSPLRRRLVAAFDRFTDARGWDDARLARTISDHGIDILVDLKGHTDQATTAVVALRPSPLVVSYLGYPGTMGAVFVDYLLGDAIVTPLSEAADYSETLVLLPDSYQINDDRRTIAATPSRSSLQLPDDAVVLCAFNASWKIGVDVMTSWSEILRRAPQAILWMQARAGDDATVERWRAILREQGVAPQRLVVATQRPHDQYLALLRQADLFLDAWPYNAHTTASDALWAGCPLLTKRGETFAGRVAESLLAAVGRRDWVAADRADYIERAVRLASDRPALVAMRRALETDVRGSRLYDTAATTRAIEAAFVAMAQQHRSGIRRPIVIPR